MISPFVKGNFTSSEEPDVLSVARDYIQKPSGIQKMVIRPAIKTLKWVEWCYTGLSQTGRECKEFLGKMNHVFLWVNFPQQIGKLGNAIVQVKNSLLSLSFREAALKTNTVFIETAFTASLFADTIEICYKEKLIELSTLQLSVLNMVGCVGSVALFFHAVIGLKKHGTRFIHAEIGSPRFKLALLRTLSKICLVVVAIFGVATFFLGTVLSQLLLLTFSTALLAFSITGHFYKKMRCTSKEDVIRVQ